MRFLYRLIVDRLIVDKEGHIKVVEGRSRVENGIDEGRLKIKKNN